MPPMRASVEETSGVTIRTGRLALPVPAVIRLLEYRRIPRRTRMLSRKGILARDRNTWENLVACCFACNNRKGGRTPDEAGMPLARYPKPVTIDTSRHMLRDTALNQQSWQKYLYYENAPAV